MSYPHAYDVREVNNGVKTSFGMSTLSQTFGSVAGKRAGTSSEMTRRVMPAHLRNNTAFQVPGPGTYQARSSVQILRRDHESKQECTWQQVRGGFNDLPKNNPGPGTYTTEHSLSQREIGFSFPLGPKDAIMSAVNKNKNPGPGSHNVKPLDERK